MRVASLAGGPVPRRSGDRKKTAEVPETAQESQNDPHSPTKLLVVLVASPLVSRYLSLATRHFAGWYMVNVLDLPSEDVAIALGHTDGGELVRKLYGHLDHERALERVTAAYDRTASFTQPQLWQLGT